MGHCSDAVVFRCLTKIEFGGVVLSSDFVALSYVECTFVHIYIGEDSTSRLLIILLYSVLQQTIVEIID